MDKFDTYLNSQANIDMQSFESLEVFLKGLDIQAAQYKNSLAVIAPTWMISTKQTLNDFLPDFQDPDQRALALRDFACIPVFSINPFFRNPAAIYARAIQSRVCPIDDILSISDAPQVANQFRPYPGAHYFFASDLSVSGDSMGIAMVCPYPLIPDAFELVFSKQIKVSKESEADFESVENLIYALQLRSFNIKCIGFDQFQSHRSKEILEKKGNKVEIVKYHDSFACQRTLKELMVTGRFIYGICDEVFMGEASELQVINSKRIDHLTSGGIFNSKDVWDAVVNALKLAMDEPAPFEAEYY